MAQQTSLINLPFNPAASYKLHIDLNSCFASVEQQANPLLRGKPLAVAAYASNWGCILAPSIEAKRWGIKTGMRVKDARVICPQLLVLSPDPWKYRIVHLRLNKLLSRYSDVVVPKSIDEFVVDFKFSPYKNKGLLAVGKQIKERIRKEIGDWLTVSIGIAPNRFLAKTGAGLHKPNGLDEINQFNYQEIFKQLKLTDLCGIADKNERRLNRLGIYNVWDFYQAPIWKLKAAFESVNGYYWYLRLRGFEIDDIDFGRKSFGNSFALPPELDTVESLIPVMLKLTEKMGARVRQGGYKAGGVHLSLSFRDGRHWGHGVTLGREIFDSRDIFQELVKVLSQCPVKKPVRVVAVTCFDLQPAGPTQLELFKNVAKQEDVVKAMDSVNQKWGSFVVSPAKMMSAKELVQDRIAFGNVKELEDFAKRYQVII